MPLSWNGHFLVTRIDPSSYPFTASGRTLSSAMVTRMTQFGIFDRLNPVPVMVYDGDFVRVDRAYETVLLYSDAPDKLVHLTATIHLDEGQNIRVLEC